MTLTREQPELERPLEHEAGLLDYFRSGEKPRDRWRVGTEHEKVGLRASTFEPLGYDEEKGLASLLQILLGVHGFEPIGVCSAGVDFTIGELVSGTWVGDRADELIIDAFERVSALIRPIDVEADIVSRAGGTPGDHDSVTSRGDFEPGLFGGDRDITVHREDV